MTVLSMALLALFLLWLQRAVYRRWWNSRLGMRITFSAAEAFEGETLTLREELTNRKPLPLPWLTAKFQLSRHLVFPGEKTARVSDDYYQNDVFSVNMYQRITREQRFVCAKRGYYRIKSMDLVSSNIFIDEKLVMHVPCGAELTVYPRLIDFGELEVVYRQLYGDIELRRFTNPDPFVFRGLREYRSDDDFRTLNFKATAKTGQLMVNVYGATASQELVILLNLEEYGAWSSDIVYEEAIRLAASVAGHFTAMGLSVGLSSNGCDAITGAPVEELPGSGAGHFESILAKLGRIDLESGSPRRPMSELMAGISAPEPASLLISSYDRDDIAEAYETMVQEGLTVRWIIPALPDMKIDMEETATVTRWEVRPYEFATRVIAPHVSAPDAG